MVALSWSTFRERWQMFLGAIITVGLGVALVQASLLVLVAAAEPTIPPGLSPTEQQTLRDGYDTATALLGMVLGLAGFVAVFIVASTFAFTVAQRRRDLALLRLVGASRGQVRRLLLGEALLLAAFGTAAGALLGVPMARLQVWLLTVLGFLPAGFATVWHPWVLGVSAGTGIGISVLGVLAASRRASRVRPLEALRATGRATRVMTVSRWIVGGVFLAGAITMLAAAPAAGPDDAAGLSLFVCMVLVVAFSGLSPLVVPLVGALFGLLVRVFLRGRPLGLLAHANLRDGVRRSAATAAPIMVLVGLVAGIGGALGAITEGSRVEATRTLRADLIVEADRPITDRLAAIGGVRDASEEVAVGFRVYEPQTDGPPIVDPADGTAIDPVAYARTHRLGGVRGDLGDLHGETVALSRGFTPVHWRVGDTVTVILAGKTRRLRVVATLPSSVAGPQFLLPRELALAGSGSRRYAVQLAAGADRTTVADRISAAGLGQVFTTADWIRRDVRQQQRGNSSVMVALLGLAMLYTLIAIVNAVVIAAADRRVEFAVLRLTGLRRGQVVRAVLWESSAVTLIGLALGALAALCTVLGVDRALTQLAGAPVHSQPLRLLGLLAAGAALIVAITSVLTTLTATRQRPIALAGARE